MAEKHSPFQTLVRMDPWLVDTGTAAALMFSSWRSMHVWGRMINGKNIIVVMN